MFSHIHLKNPVQHSAAETGTQARMASARGGSESGFLRLFSCWETMLRVKREAKRRHSAGIPQGNETQPRDACSH